MIFLECIGSRACLSAEIKTSPVKSTFYGTFSFYPVTTERHSNAHFRQSSVTKSLQENRENLL